MKLFACACGSVVFFESVRCETCGRALGFAPDRGAIVALEPAGDALVAVGGGARYRPCANATEHQACNWLVPDGGRALCRACELNEIIPDLGQPGALAAWRILEAAKRRLVFTLDELDLPLAPRARAPGGVAFAFLANASTGHADGLITIDIAEADAAARERVRVQLDERYRTVLGHFRHEIGHYFWQRLIAPEPDAFRARFGDERADYAAAKARHYEAGPPADWVTRHVSAYASMHPWEDWAETWAHYLHIVDTLQTARSYGLALRPAGAPIAKVEARKLDFDDFDDLIDAWVPLTLALNSLNRSMGLPDPYAFVLSAEAIAKLRFVHDTIDRAVARDRAPMPGTGAPIAQA